MRGQENGEDVAVQHYCNTQRFFFCMNTVLRPYGSRFMERETSTHNSILTKKYNKYVSTKKFLRKQNNLEIYKKPNRFSG